MKQFKKKVARITGILILLLGLFMSPLFVPVKAGTNIWDYNFVYTANNVRATASGYGCVLDDYYASNSNANTRFKHVITVNFNEVVSGTVNLTFNFERGDIVLTENCTVEFYAGSSTTGFAVRVNNVSWCKIEVYTQSDTRFLMDMTHNCSVSTDSDNAYLGTMLSIFQDSTYGFRSMAIDVQNIWAALSNSDGNVITTLQSIYYLMSNDYDDYLSCLLSLYDHNNGVGYLAEIYDILQNLNIPDTSSYFTSLIGLITNTNGYIDGLETTCTNIYNRLTNINTNLTNISTNLLTYVRTNLDIPRWQIPAYKWVYDVSYKSGQYSAWTHNGSNGLSFRYTQPSPDSQYTVDNSFGVEIGTTDYPYGRKFIVSWASPSPGSNYNIFWLNLGGGGSLPSGWYCETFTGTASNGGYRDGLYYNYVIVYANYTPQTISNRFEIEFTSRIQITPIYVGYLDVMPDDAYALLGIRKTNELLEAATSYFDDSLDLLQQIADGISGLSGSQTDINNSISITNDFDTSMTTVNNVEVGILTDIDVKFENVINSLTINDMVNPGTPVNDPTRLFSFYFSHLSSRFSGFKTLIYLLLIFFVLLVLMG